jgi:hypothetical protein
LPPVGSTDAAGFMPAEMINFREAGCDKIRRLEMLDTNSDLGAALFKTWSDKQRLEEIGRLVEGYRNGLPVGILCKMTETIAGDQRKAKKILKQLLSQEEREQAVSAATGGMVPLLKSFLE